MYTLYYSQGACSVATQVVLHELQQDVKIIDVQQLDNFKEINPVGAVPTLVDGEQTLTEGAAIMLHILSKHKSSLFPGEEGPRQKAIEDIMFANATMHPAYGRLFFLSQNVSDEKVKQDILDSAAESINQLWEVVENQLKNKNFLGGDSPSAADIMLTVYSRWGAYFPVKIVFGEKTTQMLDAVQAMSSFKKADEAEQAVSSKKNTSN
ncbi:MAG: glutathione S-transferase family protein [Oceanospirillaceae bacterium]|nr:glutathione S-transferase family protein [Oceanospirillaceae bacterium]